MTLRVALPKGRIQGDVLRALGAAAPAPAALQSRQLILDGADGTLSFVLVKDPDIPKYVERGAADVGIVGLDVLREHDADVLEPLTTTLGRCRMSLCAKPGTDLAALARDGVLKVATKYPRSARAELMQRGLPAEIVHLQGSVELAVLVGLADAIVDLVETGETLRQNGLVVLEDLYESTARVVVNRASFRLHHDEVRAVLRALESAHA